MWLTTLIITGHVKKSQGPTPEIQSEVGHVGFWSIHFGELPKTRFKAWLQLKFGGKRREMLIKFPSWGVLCFLKVRHPICGKARRNQYTCRYSAAGSCKMNLITAGNSYHWCCQTWAFYSSSEQQRILSQMRGPAHLVIKSRWNYKLFSKSTKV